MLPVLRLLLAALITLSQTFSALAQTNAPKDCFIVIKATTNKGETDSGDYWLAADLKAAFEQLGCKAHIDYRGEHNTSHTPEPMLNIYMRGYTEFKPPFPKGYNLLYSYYPMAYTETSGQKIAKSALNAQAPSPENANLDDDWQNFDILGVASSQYTKELNAGGVNAIWLPQFTNPEKFYPAPDPALKEDILFVGSNWHNRTSLQYALNQGFKVAVYGYNWSGVVPPEMYKAPYIKNTDLNRYYSSAKIVLNDHRPDMLSFGFVNNRIYDATAAGTLVISDYIPEIKEIYGDTIPMYQNEKELARLLDYYLSHEDERQKLAAAARKITLQHFTNLAIAKKILSLLPSR